MIQKIRAFSNYTRITVLHAKAHPGTSAYYKSRLYDYNRTICGSDRPAVAFRVSITSDAALAIEA